MFPVTNWTRSVCIYQCQHADWWVKCNLSSEEQIMTLTGSMWKLMIECNSLYFMKYVRIIYTIMLQVFIMIFNLSCNLASTQLSWEFRWMHKSCIAWERVVNWLAWINIYKIIVRRNIFSMPMWVTGMSTFLVSSSLAFLNFIHSCKKVRKTHLRNNA